MSAPKRPSDDASALHEVRDALAAVGRRLDELAERVARLGPVETPTPVGDALDEATRGQLAETEALLAIGPVLGRDTALVLAVDRAVHRAGADCAALFLPGLEGGMQAAVTRGFAGEVPRLEIGEGIVGRAFLGEEAIVGSAAHHPRDRLLRDFGLGQALAIPVRLAGEPSRGVLLAGRRRPIGFDAGALGTLVMLADRVAIVLSATGSATGGGAPVAFAADLDLERTAATVARMLAARLGVAHLALLLVGHDRLELAAGVGLPSDARAPEAAAEPLARVLRTGEAWLGVPDAEEPLAALLGAVPRLVVALVAGGQPLGLVAAGGPAPVSLAPIIGWLPSAAVALRNARLHAETLAALRRGGEAAPGPAPAPPVRDLGRLLAVLLARIGLVRERLTEPTLAADLAVAEEAAWRAVETMRAVVGFGPGLRAEGLAPLDLTALVRSGVATARDRWAARSPSAPAVELDVEPLPPVLGQADELREALDHLLENAADAVAGGSRITVRARWDGGRRVVLEVRDDGAGMEEAVRQRALEPFFSTRGGGRLGLGLAIVQATATRHRGTFDLVSAPGQGTTARLTLPTATAELPPAGATEPPAARVLVIEDEPAVREALVGLLHQRGYRALAAVDGSEALAIVQREPVDVVFTDLAVAAVSGFDVARAVKRLRPGTPVVLITGWPGRLDRAEVEASGIDRVIEKPVGAPEVFAALESALGARRGKPA